MHLRLEFNRLVQPTFSKLLSTHCDWKEAFYRPLYTQLISWDFVNFKCFPSWFQKFEFWKKIFNYNALENDWSLILKLFLAKTLWGQWSIKRDKETTRGFIKRHPAFFETSKRQLLRKKHFETLSGCKASPFCKGWVITTVHFPTCSLQKFFRLLWRYVHWRSCFWLHTVWNPGLVSLPERCHNFKFPLSELWDFPHEILPLSINLGQPEKTELVLFFGH